MKSYNDCSILICFIHKSQNLHRTFTRLSQNYYLCPFAPDKASVNLSNSVAQEYKWSPGYPKLLRGPEHLESKTLLSASGDTKPQRSGTRVVPIQTRDVLSSLTVSSLLKVLRNKIPRPHPGLGDLDKAGDLRRRSRGLLASGLFRDADAALQRNHVTVGERLKGRDLGKP